LADCFKAKCATEFIEKLIQQPNENIKYDPIKQLPLYLTQRKREVNIIQFIKIFQFQTMKSEFNLFSLWWEEYFGLLELEF